MRFGSSFSLLLLLLSTTAPVLPSSAQSHNPSASGSTFHAPLQLRELPSSLQKHARPILESPSFKAQGPVEILRCDPRIYYWLLDHPDKACQMWKRLGATCTTITATAPGRYSWSDDKGSQVNWSLVVRNAQRWVWYAEGNVKPGRLLPRVPVRALFVLHVREEKDRLGKPVIRQQSDLLIHTTSRAMRLVARVVGASAPRLAENYMAQIQLFFGALATHLTEHPEKIAILSK